MAYTRVGNYREKPSKLSHLSQSGDGGSGRYLERCLRELERWGAPLSGWRCIGLIDACEEGSGVGFETCDLCGCSRVRYVHVMHHERYFEDVMVGCICAGVMEDDILAAKDRERRAANRSRRRRNFIRRVWGSVGWFHWHIRNRSRTATIDLMGENPDRYVVRYDGRRSDRYKGRPIGSLLEAKYAAFDLADPPEEIL